MDDLISRIKSLRKAKGMTQADVAELSDLSLSYYKAVEGGSRSPSVDALRRIAKTLGTSMNFLLNDRVEVMEGRVEIEVERLNKIFSSIPRAQLQTVEGLIVQAARLRVLLDDNWRDIAEFGEYEKFQQSENLAPYDRKRPIVENYDQRDKTYKEIIKQLTDLLPKETVKKKSSVNRLLGG